MSQLNGKTLKDKKILIVGFGSIGKKHHQAISKLGCKVSILSRSKKDITNLNPHFVNKKEAKMSIYDLVILCNNTSEHLSDLFDFYNSGSVILIEKPIYHLKLKKHEVDKLNNMEKVYVGYNLRYLEIIKFLREYFTNKKIESIYSQFWDNCLEWYKDRVLSESYILNKEKGGGAFFTNYHEMDYIKFILSSELESCFWSPFFSEIKEFSADTYSNVSGIMKNQTIYNSSLWLLSSKRLRVGSAFFEKDYLNWDIDAGMVWKNNKLIFNKASNYIESYELQILDLLLNSRPISSTLQSNINDLNKIFK
jgi:predicted dehydrogenase